MVKTRIVNVVTTASLGQKVNLDKLEQFPEILHDPEKYGGRVAYFKLPKMRGRVSIFASGKMISVGTRSEKAAFCELEMAMKFLVEIGFAEHVSLDPKTRNIVATADFEKSISLEKLTEDSRGIYEPEQFPGAMLRFEKPYKASILVFASGKVVITGLTSSGQIDPTIRELKQLIEHNQ